MPISTVLLCMRDIDIRFNRRCTWINEASFKEKKIMPKLVFRLFLWGIEKKDRGSPKWLCQCGLA